MGIKNTMAAARHLKPAFLFRPVESGCDKKNLGTT